jgi:hypothetical protein
MPPRTALAFGAAVGVTVTYFVGLLSGLTLGTLLWRTAIGGVALGGVAFLMVWLLGDPLDWEEPEEPEEEAEGEEAPSMEADEEGGGDAATGPAYPSDRDLE